LRPWGPQHVRWWQPRSGKLTLGSNTEGSRQSVVGSTQRAEKYGLGAGGVQHLWLDAGRGIGKLALSQGERVDRSRRFSAGAGRVRGRLPNNHACSSRGYRADRAAADFRPAQAVGNGRNPSPVRRRLVKAPSPDTHSPRERAVGFAIVSVPGERAVDFAVASFSLLGERMSANLNGGRVRGSLGDQ
jgi:hypothetical protein